MIFFFFFHLGILVVSFGSITSVGCSSQSSFLVFIGMEKLKALVPDALEQEIGESTPSNLISSASSLLDFFHNLPLFHQIVGDLTDPERALCGKNKEAALEAKLKGNDCFSKGEYSDAVRFYSQALRNAPMHTDDVAKDPGATLYVNRASAFYKMGLLVECLRDTTRALLISPEYAKAWFRRGKANASLGNYEDSVRDLNVSLKLERALGGKRQIQMELETILDQSKGMDCSQKQSNESYLDVYDEPCEAKLKCIFTETKGRGMVSQTDIVDGSLIHKEDPYAAIILKHCRETHCHFCFGELPMDALSCLSCSIPLYCSEQCQVRAGGQKVLNFSRNIGAHANLSDDLVKYVSDVISVGVSGSSLEDYTEHSHECNGAHWPLVLPSEIVLAGRVLVKHIKQQRYSCFTYDLQGVWDLFHNYPQLHPESKLESHIYSIILLHCLQHSYVSELPIDGKTVSQVVILLSQIRVNSMAIVRIKSFDMIGSLNQYPELSLFADASTTAIEQVRVGQAVYSAGSLFNHSCLPNIHAYFVSRMLYIRATEFVEVGSQLELSYGPQVGQLGCKDRQQLLEDRYSFRCECKGCLQLNLSDLVLNAYRCVEPNCFGVVLDNNAVKYVKQKHHCFHGVPRMHSSNPNQAGKLERNNVTKVASMLENFHQCKPGYCLNCESYHDLEVSQTTMKIAEFCYQRLQDAVASNNVSTGPLTDGLTSIDLLQKTFHPYNKRIAEVEDSLAQALCLAGDLQQARDHCQKSIEILEVLYDPNHIAIGNELLKLASIQLSLGDHSAADNLDRVAAIFSRHYGSHTNLIFPHLQYLKKEACKLH